MDIVAGVGCSGSVSSMLNSPAGIFVTVHFDLYVADYNNDRVQLFRSGESSATTVVGKRAPGTFVIFRPTGIVLDGDGYLFVVDQMNHRVIGSGPAGYRCVVGCSKSGGKASNQLNQPNTMSFDSMGNIFVNDRGNTRIQKFLLANNSCGKWSEKERLAGRLVRDSIFTYWASGIKTIFGRRRPSMKKWLRKSMDSSSDCEGGKKIFSSIGTGRRGWDDQSRRLEWKRLSSWRLKVCLRLKWNNKREICSTLKMFWILYRANTSRHNTNYWSHRSVELPSLLFASSWYL